MFKQQPRTGKLVAVIWLLMPVLILGIAIYGWKIGDVVGGVLVSMMPMGLLAVISAFLSLVVGGAAVKTSKWIWIATSVAGLLAAIMFANRTASDAVQGAEIMLGYTMTIMSFPLGLLAPCIFIGVKQLNSTVSNLVVVWAAFLIIGYLQWFVLSRATNSAGSGSRGV